RCRRFLGKARAAPRSARWAARRSAPGRVPGWDRRSESPAARSALGLPAACWGAPARATGSAGAERGRNAAGLFAACNPSRVPTPTVPRGVLFLAAYLDGSMPPDVGYPTDLSASSAVCLLPGSRQGSLMISKRAFCSAIAAWLVLLAGVRAAAQAPQTTDAPHDVPDLKLSSEQKHTIYQ